MQVILRPSRSVGWFFSMFGQPASSPEAARKLRLEKQVRRDLHYLLERARLRRYADTVNVLSFYWLQTLRESYTPAHWPILQHELQRALESGASEVEIQAIRRASEWVRLAEPDDRLQAEKPDRIPAFTSQNLEPSIAATQVFLETLLNGWLPERILDRYGLRDASDWTAENAYEEAANCLEQILRTWTKVPDVGAVQALDLLQHREPSPREAILLWRRKRQASLESLVRVHVREAGTLDPKLREILNDVILYLLGTTAPAPAAEPGYAAAFSGLLGNNLPPEISQQVSRFPLPPDYLELSSLLIPVSSWPAPAALRSTLLTSDGRLWQARGVGHEAGSQPWIEYTAIGRSEVLPQPGGLLLRTPLGLWPEEVSPQLNQSLEFELYNHRWHMLRVEGSGTEAHVLYHAIQEPAGILKVEAREPRTHQAHSLERPWLRAS